MSGIAQMVPSVVGAALGFMDSVGVMKVGTSFR